MAAALSAPASHWRLELFYKSHDELRNIVPFLQTNNIKRVNITNKREEDDLLGSVQVLRDSIPDVDVCCHYSLKYNHVKGQGRASLQPSFDKFNRFTKDMATSCQTGSVLLVSGGGEYDNVGSSIINGHGLLAHALLSVPT